MIYIINYFFLLIIFLGIQGYVRSAIIVLTNGTSSYGNGSITDTFYRLPVFVSKFTGEIKKGSHVELRGRLRVNEHNTIILQVPDIDNIAVVTTELANWEFMKAGFNPLLLSTEDVEDGKMSNSQSDNNKRRKSSLSPKEDLRFTAERTFVSLKKIHIFRILIIKFLICLVRFLMLKERHC